jgi:hypothetical protein
LTVLAMMVEADCPPSVVVTGDASLVTAITAELSRHGIETAVRPGCRAGRARVAKTATAILVSVEDPFGRTSEREVDRVDAGAAVIESWLRDDLKASLLAPRGNLDTPAPPPPVAIARPAPPSDGPSPHPRWGLGVVGEAGLDEIAGVWWGARAETCLRLGWVCVGGLARLANANSRREVDVMGSLGVPLRLSAVTVMPALAAGMGWLRVDTGGGMGQQQSHAGGRFGTSVTTLYPLARYLAIEAVVSADWSPSANPSSQNQNDTSTPGEPRVYVRAGIGLRVGVP